LLKTIVASTVQSSVQSAAGSSALAATAAHLLPPPEQRIAAVRPFWQQLSSQQQLEFLSIPVQKLQQYAEQVAAEVLAAGEATGDYLHCLKTSVIWKAMCKPCIPALVTW
jgi:hypothetical protein